MISIVICVFFACMIFVIFKVAGLRHLNNTHVALINYVTATVLAFLASAPKGDLAVFAGLPEADIRTLMTVKNLPNTALILLLFGLITGVGLAMNLLLTKDSIAGNGTGVTSFFKQSGYIGGLFVAIAFFGERPSALQWLAIAVLLSALALLVHNFTQLKIQKPILLLFLLLSGVVVEASKKFVSQYSINSYQTLYLSVAFLVSTMYTGGNFLLTERTAVRKFHPEEFLFGGLLGLSNVLTNYFKLQSMNALPASVVIPTIAAGTLISTTLVGIFIFREKTSLSHIAAVALAILSLILLNCC